MAEKKGKLAEIKTKETNESVTDFIHSLDNAQKREDSLVLLEMMREVSGEEPKIWGKGLIGFGNKRYKSPASGREVDWFLVGFAPRKAALSVYIMDHKEHLAAIEKLGKYKTDGGCIYINKLQDVDLEVLKSVVTASYKNLSGK